MHISGFKKVLPYAVVVFFGFVGFSMPLPIFPEMFLGADAGVLPVSYTQEWKTFLLGLIMSAYPAGQLIGSPILGKCSDRWGRKKVIILSLIGCLFGYVGTAWAVQSSSITSMFLGLFFCGLCEGNVAIAQSVVADLAAGDVEKKTVYFGWINLFICLAFIVGPILGGVLSDSSLSSSFSFATPFWVGAILTTVAILTIFYFSEETRKDQLLQEKMGYWKGFVKGFHQKTLGKFYLVNFFLALGYFSYFRFFPVYLKEVFSFTSSQLGYVIAYGSIAFAIAAFLFLKPVAKKMSPEKAVAVFAIGLALCMILIFIPNASWSFFVTTLPVNACLAVVMTYSSVLISEAAPVSFQGQALGILTSVQVCAEALTGLGGGILASYDSFLPMWIGSLMFIMAALFLFAFKGKNGNPFAQK
jgi:MFS family permease